MKYIEKLIAANNSGVIKFVIVYFSAIEDINPWRLASYQLLDLFEESKDYIFGGYINIEDYEIETDKYNL